MSADVVVACVAVLGVLLGPGAGGGAGVVRADTVVPLVGSASQNNTGVGFSGSIAYDSSEEQLTVTLTNISSVASVLTGFVFNIDAAVTASYLASDNAATVGVNEGSWGFETGDTNPGGVTGPFGDWDAGAALLVLSMQQVRGVNNGETGIFKFDLAGPDAGLLTASSFTSEINTGGGLSSFFLARFMSVGSNGQLSDRMVAAIPPDGPPPPAVPLPAAAWAGMALIGALGANGARTRWRAGRRASDEA